MLKISRIEKVGHTAASPHHIWKTLTSIYCLLFGQTITNSYIRFLVQYRGMVFVFST